MQDFTKLATTKDITSLSQVSPNKAHEKWLNKDRIWNLVFCFGMSAGFSIVAAIVGANKSMHRFPYEASVIFWLTLIGVPLLLKCFSKTTFIKDTIFINNEGKELDITQNLPDSGLVIISTAALAFLTGAALDSKLLSVPDILGSIILIMVIFAIPTLFFIFKNCPIAILFNYKFWTLKPYYGRCSKSNNDYYDGMYSSHNSLNKITSPGHSYRPENIWHNR